MVVKAAIILGLSAILFKAMTFYFHKIHLNDMKFCQTSGEKEGLVLMKNMTDDLELRKGPIVSNSWHCYFGDSYSDMRTRFREAATDLGLTVYPYPLPNHPELTTDVVVLEGSPNNNNVVFHISGTHGPEGFVGSATQSAFLKQVSLCRTNSTCAATVHDSWPTIVLVHALNAYGFANDRRFTEENVDLNRNFLTETEFAELIQRDHNLAGYMDFDHLINPTEPQLLHMPTSYPEDLLTETNTAVDAVLARAHCLMVFYINEAWGFVKAGQAVLKHGVNSIKRALVSGNYYKPSGVYYGGRELTHAARIMFQIAEDHVNHRLLKDGVDPSLQQAILIDVHSGLGPSGVDTLAVDTFEELSAIESIFPTEYHELNKRYAMLPKSKQRPPKGPARPRGGLKDASMGNKAAQEAEGGGTALGGYDLMVGGVSQGFAPYLLPHLEKNKRKHSVTQEFGTVNMIVTGQRVATENYAYHHGTAFEKKVAGKNLRSCFYVESSKQWKYDVVRRGVIVLTQALQYLSVKG